MANFSVDLTNYKSLFGDYVAPGTYLVQVEDIDADESRDKKPQMRVYFRILDGDAKGSTLVERYSLSPDAKNLFRTVAFLSGFGVPTPRKNIAFNSKTLIGRKAKATVRDNEYNGRVSSQIDSFTRLVSSKPSEGATEKDDLDALEQLGDESLDTTNSVDVDLDDIEI